MPKHFAFLFNARDVSVFITKRESEQNVTVFASGLDTFDTLDKEKIPYQEIKTYPPLSVTMQHYGRAHRIALQFDPTIYASARNFFLELFRSAYLASTIIKKYRPSVVYISDIINESLYRKYHSETFNLLPQAIIAFCRKCQIPLRPLSQKRQPGSLWSSFLAQTLANLRSCFSARQKPAKIISRKTPTILISASSYHLMNLKGFINQVAKKWSIIILGKSTRSERRQLPQYNISFADTYSYLGLLDLIKTIGCQLIIWLQSYISSSRQSPNILLKEFDLELKSIIQTAWQYWQVILAPQGQLLTLAFDRLLKTSQPQILISSNSIDNFNRTLHMVAKKNKVKDSVILHYPLMNIIDAIEEQSGIEQTLFLAGNRTLHLIERYPGNYRAVSAGNPIFDKYLSFRGRSCININVPIHVLFLVTQEFLYFQNTNDIIIHEALDELGKFPIPIKVTIRQHPQEKPLDLNYDNFHFPISTNNNSPLSQQLINHDIIIAQNTSAAVEAIIISKPLIYLNTHTVRNFRPFATSGAALGVYKISELLPAINSLLKNPNQLSKQQDRFVSMYCGKIDGQTSRRIITYLELISKLTLPSHSVLDTESI